MSHPNPNFELIQSFHSKLYNTHPPTPLISLPELATQLGCAGVYVKDESERFGLPAFKILGASWGLCSALAERVGVDMEDLEGVGREARGRDIRVYAATDGNHGRAVARVANQLGIPAIIYVPTSVEEWSREAIRSEGATVVVVDGSYDEAVCRAAADCAGVDGLLVQDTSWEGYEDIPLRIVHGYSQLFYEVDSQLPHAQSASHVVVPVGVGSLAHAAVLWYNPNPSNTEIITVEPTTAACFRTSLLAGEITPIETGHTIMPGLNCGTVSHQAWPDLRGGVKLENALVVGDDEVERAMEDLEGWGVMAGPCGAASLAGLRQMKRGLRKSDVVVLICTEGKRRQ